VKYDRDLGIRIEDIQQVRNKQAMVQSTYKEHHKVNLHLESAEMDVKESDRKLRVKYHAIVMS
jgi:hypothetical protein